MHNITAKIVKDSTCNNTRITTFELEYPRFIHAEFMTHRMLSKNCASSRAIPVETMHKNIADNTAMPVYWGKNQAGMQAAEELSPEEIKSATSYWLKSAGDAIQSARILLHAGLHKQISNRVTEPFQMMKTVATGTEWANLLHLRDHGDAQPEFRVLAKSITAAFNSSVPQELRPGQWHLPYVDNIVGSKDNIAVSVSCCAQVSYRKSDDSLEKAKMIYERLIKTDGPMHASPMEHQACAIEFARANEERWPLGITHMRRDGSLWSANFRGWIQYRQLIDGNTKW